MLLDVGGQDATEAFEDVGHSDEAREILEGLFVADLKRAVCPPPNNASCLYVSTSAPGLSLVTIGPPSCLEIFPNPTTSRYDCGITCY